MSIASTSTTSSSLADPAFKIYRRYKYKCEGDCDWGDEEDIFRNKIMYLGNVDESSPPPPPFVVLVQGPPNVGKSLLIKSLVKYFDPMKDITNGPNIIITADKKRRLQLVECLDDIDAMIDAAKYADLVLLLVDANYGFEAETFEFLNLLQAHGLPKVMGVLTHLDQLKDYTKLNETEERLQDLFRTEIYQGAITYNISGLQDDLYNMQDVQVLAEQILTLQLHLSSRRAAHPFVLVDCFEDVTPPEKVLREANCGRNISLYGYLRGCDIKSGAKVHIAGLDDFHLAGVRSTIDPFPLSEENNFVMLTPMENETFRTGTYLRLEVHDVPFRMVANFYSCHPILVGGISPEDKDVGYMQAMLKRHNWHMKLLMSAEPVTMSAGWRRYGTKPIYARQIDNARHQIRDFIPEREHCLAMFWGPLAPKPKLYWQSLDLSYNSITGYIHSSISNLKFLRTLELSFNALNGSIPESIYNLTFLSTLDLSYNDFKGSIPESISNLKFLRTIYLSGNNLQNSIPKSISNLKSLRKLYLNYNDFNGSIPKSIYEMYSLEELDLSNNNITGFIPKSICEMYSLRLLDLSSNNITGFIPKSICKLRE